MHPKISVVIANYNCAEYLKECLISLQNQNYKLSEIIIIDNGSKDESEKICEKFNVKFHKLNRNYGLCFAYNLGASLSKSDFILFSNNDIKFDFDTIKILIDEIIKDENIFSVDPMQYNWDNTKIIHGVVILKKTKFRTKFLPNIELDATVITDKEKHFLRQQDVCL